MNDKDPVENLLIAFLALFAFCFGVFAGHLKGESAEQREAVKAGVGEYYLDKDNEKQFRYIPKDELRRP